MFVEERRSLSCAWRTARSRTLCLGVGPGRVGASDTGSVHGRSATWTPSTRVLLSAGRGAQPLADRPSGPGSDSCPRHSGFARRRVCRSGAVDVGRKARLLHLADETARGLSPEVRQVIAAYSESVQKVWIAGFARARLATDRQDAGHCSAVTVMAERDGLIQTGRETLAYHGGFELLEDEAVAGLAREAAQKALVMLDSGRLRPAECR